MKNLHTFVDYLIFLNKEEKEWYKFTKNINKTIKQDLDHVFIAKEVSNTETSDTKTHLICDYDKPRVIIKGMYDTYWRVYFINKTCSAVAYLTPGGHVFIEELFTRYNDINKVYQTNGYGISNYHSQQIMQYRIKHYSFIDNWINTYTEDVKNEAGKTIRRIKAKDIII